MYFTIFVKIFQRASLEDTWPLSKKDISCPPRPVQIILSQSSTSLCVIWPPQLLLQPSNILFMAAGAKWLLSDGWCYVVFLKVVVPYQRVALALEHFRKHFNMFSLLLGLCSCSLISPIPLPRPFSQCKIPRGLGRRVISDRCCRKYLHCLALPCLGRSSPPGQMVGLGKWLHGANIASWSLTWIPSDHQPGDQSDQHGGNLQKPQPEWTHQKIWFAT